MNLIFNHEFSKQPNSRVIFFFLQMQDEIGCSSSQVSSRGSSNGEASSTMESSRLLKQPKIAEINQSGRNQDHIETKSRSTAIISYLKRLQKHTITNDDDASATITGICRLSRDQSR